MTVTCPRCAQGIVIDISVPQFEVRVVCPRCGQRIVIEVGSPQGVGPTEFKEPYRANVG